MILLCTPYFDVGSNSVKTYKLNPNDYFSLEIQNEGDPTVSAELLLQKSLDREKQAVIRLVVTAVDGGKYPRSGTLQITVNVMDVNDNSPAFSKPLYKVKLKENVPYATPVLTLNATDPDEGLNGQILYSIPGQRNVNLNIFTIDSMTGEISLVLQKALDREKQAMIQLVLTAFDGGKPPRSGTLQITVNVLDNNDNSPVFSSSLYKVRVVENAPPGTKIISLNATDADEGKNGEVLYLFNRHGQEKILDTFMIHPDTGDVTVKGDIDFEKSAFYEIRVEAQDKGQSPMVTHCKLIVEVTDVNDNLPQISVTSLLNTIKEDSKIGAAIALVTVTDNDGGSNGKLNCTLNGAVPFKLQTSYSNYYSIILDGPLDREIVSQYNVTITATDEGTPALSSTSVITVHVSDVNDNAPRFPEPLINIYVKENNQIGTVIYTVSAADPDENENARVSYSLIEGSSARVPLSSVINVNSASGEIYSLQSFNYEEVKTFQFQVQATDSGEPPLSSNVTVKVFILDENDNKERFGYHSCAAHVIQQGISNFLESR
uniref:Protocadherin 2 alpha b2 n=1 Tax=Paramormyrops kingsleyae TaxID=1676925 RepID=A0A3B3RGP2_9TELE